MNKAGPVRRVTLWGKGDQELFLMLPVYIPKRRKKQPPSNVSIYKKCVDFCYGVWYNLHEIIELGVRHARQIYANKSRRRGV